MQKAKTLFLILASLILYSFITPSFVVNANSAPPPSYFYSFVTSTDSKVAYSDILINISKTSEYYIDLNSSNAAAYAFDKSTPIAAYNQDGYVSISFHCKGVHSEPSVLMDDVGMCGIVWFDEVNTPISAITNSIKIALLDKNGNVLKVSDAVNVIPSISDTFPRTVRYDAGGTTPSVEFDKYYKRNSANTVYLSDFMILAFLIRMAISTATETLIAVPFKIRPLWKIATINIATQILLFAFIASGRLDYTNAVIAGEIFVYISEFVAYILLFKHISKSKLALYTVIANTISLAVGLIFNSLHVFVG